MKNLLLFALILLSCEKVDVGLVGTEWKGKIEESGTLKEYEKGEYKYTDYSTTIDYTIRFVTESTGQITEVHNSSFGSRVDPQKTMTNTFTYEYDENYQSGSLVYGEEGASIYVKFFFKIRNGFMDVEGTEFYKVR